MEWFQEDIGEKKYRTALIGPAGEKMVSYANIMVDCRNAFGRCGMGAVMGSKRLKGVVVKGSQRPTAANIKRVPLRNTEPAVPWMRLRRWAICPFAIMPAADSPVLKI
jgi:aldehyde:ferredoxin oxidoreductase